MDELSLVKGARILILEKSGDGKYINGKHITCKIIISIQLFTKLLYKGMIYIHLIINQVGGEVNMGTKLDGFPQITHRKNWRTRIRIQWQKIF